MGGGIFDPRSQWQNGYWYGASRLGEDLAPGPDGLPLGVLVLISLDPDDPVASNEDILGAFQFQGVVVREGTREGAGRRR